MTQSPAPFWDRRRHLDRRPLLAARANITAAVRAWFAAEGFIEADVGALVMSPGAETHLQAFAAGEGFLHTSPEFAMKKLLAAGEERIFFLGKVYRAGERSPLHAPEFTMLEWYRAGARYEAVMDDVCAIARIAAAAAGAETLSWRGRRCRLDAPTPITVAQAFRAHAGLDLFAPDLPADARAAGAHVAPDDQWTDVFSKILVDRIEPRLGEEQLTLLTEYPLEEAALARPTTHDPRLAERFELYACGVELANGFGELIDPVEQRRRFIAAMDEKQRRYGARWPLDEDFLAALAHMPPASGCALGLDRLVMLAAGAPHIDDVLWTPAPRPSA